MVAAVGSALRCWTGPDILLLLLALDLFDDGVTGSRGACNGSEADFGRGGGVKLRVLVATVALFDPLWPVRGGEASIESDVGAASRI